MTSRISARGGTLEEAFARLALGVVGRGWEPDGVEERDVREVRAHGQTVEALLANWINECLYLHEVEGFAFRRIDFAVFDAAPRGGAEPMRLHSFLYGQELGPDERGVCAPVAAVSPPAVSLQALGEGWEISLDV